MVDNVSILDFLAARIGKGLCSLVCGLSVMFSVLGRDLTGLSRVDNSYF